MDKKKDATIFIKDLDDALSLTRTVTPIELVAECVAEHQSNSHMCCADVTAVVIAALRPTITSTWLAIIRKQHILIRKSSLNNNNNSWI